MVEFKESKFYKLLQDFFINNDKETFIQFLAEFYNRTEGIIDKNIIQDELIKELRELYVEFNEKGIDENIVREKVNYFLENSAKIKDILAKLVINTNKIENNTEKLNIITTDIYLEESKLFDKNDISIALNDLFSKYNGGVINIKSGEYKFSNFEVPSNFLIQGRGKGSTILIPISETGECIRGKKTSYNASVRGVSIKSESYNKDLIGLSLNGFMYFTGEDIEVWNCGVGFDFNAKSTGCYYNKLYRSRSVGNAIGVRTVHNSGQTHRSNANTIEDIEIINSIEPLNIRSGNTNFVNKIKIETLNIKPQTPTLYIDGTEKEPSDRWAIIIGSTFNNYLNDIRAEFTGNLLNLGSSYGNYLSNLFLIYNGNKDDYETLSESPTNTWQTNNLTDVELGWSLPSIGSEYYYRRGRLGQKIVLPPQVKFTPRDTSGPPATGDIGDLRVDSLGRYWSGVGKNIFKQLAFVETPTNKVAGMLKYSRGTYTMSSQNIGSKSYLNFNISMPISVGDSAFITLSEFIPDGVIMTHRVTLNNVTVRLYNNTENSIILPQIIFTATRVMV